MKAGHPGTCITIPVKAEKNTKSYGTIFLCCFPPCPGRDHLQPLPKQVQTRLLWPLKVSLWPLGQKLGLLSLSLTVTFPSSFYPVTPPSRYLIERVQGIGWALRSLNIGTPQTIHSQLLPQAHSSLVPSFPQCSPPSEKPAPPSSGHPGFARLGGSEGAKEPGKGFAQVENNDRSKYTPG